uniref:DNA mismatch repair proteins mutS family domain-containing protein n=1 Tax=Parascaris univalens TaxID=6257 RepID=A0A915A2Z5_PARUN
IFIGIVKVADYFSFFKPYVYANNPENYLFLWIWNLIGYC